MEPGAHPQDVRVQLIHGLPGIDSCVQSIELAVQFCERVANPASDKTWVLTWYTVDLILVPIKLRGWRALPAVVALYPWFCHWYSVEGLDVPRKHHGRAGS
jgi:hypothetical protein